VLRQIHTVVEDAKDLDVTIGGDPVEKKVSATSAAARNVKRPQTGSISSRAFDPEIEGPDTSSAIASSSVSR